ncbi:glucosamine-6-phosphate deaminase [Alkalibacillus aidingensis]|uniref:glucosamine-6-phosphate deaminase n=1 Tax=Alkalibacillus aidingensis TaxID=2747607 RepID=UPI001661224D|nr:glucosamine-6-phosphate deaminase [Alkalibacillus aidingensis]
MKQILTNHYQEFSKQAAELVLDLVNHQPDATLGLATGSTPQGMYEIIRQSRADFSKVTTFNLDEYVGLGAHHPQSYRTFMNQELFNHIQVYESNIPNGLANDLEKECQRYEEKIQSSGGIDLQILGLGHNGHIGFNEPGTPFTSRTHVVNLAETTRQANARFFNRLDEVPTQAITMGIESIMEAKQILLLVYGSDKSKALDRLLNGEVSESFPASILHKHDHVTLLHVEVVSRIC